MLPETALPQRRLAPLPGCCRCAGPRAAGARRHSHRRHRAAARWRAFGAGADAAPMGNGCPSGCGGRGLPKGLTPICGARAGRAARGLRDLLRASAGMTNGYQPGTAAGGAGRRRKRLVGPGHVDSVDSAPGGQRMGPIVRRACSAGYKRLVFFGWGEGFCLVPFGVEASSFAFSISAFFLLLGPIFLACSQARMCFCRRCFGKINPLHAWRRQTGQQGCAPEAKEAPRPPVGHCTAPRLKFCLSIVHQVLPSWWPATGLPFKSNSILGLHVRAHQVHSLSLVNYVSPRDIPGFAGALVGDPLSVLPQLLRETPSGAPEQRTLVLDQHHHVLLFNLEKYSSAGSNAGSSSTGRELHNLTQLTKE